MKKALTRKTFEGLYGIVPTPFDREGNLSVGLLRDMLTTLTHYDINGVVMAGTSGEYFSIQDDEKIRMTEVAAEVLADTRINLVVGGSAPSLAQQIRMGRELRKAGAQALLNLASIGCALTDNEYVEFWRRLADGVGEIGLVLYHFDRLGPLPGFDAVI